MGRFIGKSEVQFLCLEAEGGVGGSSSIILADIVGGMHPLGFGLID